MRLRKNRLLFLAAFGLLVKWVGEERKKAEAGDYSNPRFGFSDFFDRPRPFGEKTEGRTIVSESPVREVFQPETSSEDVYGNTIKVIGIDRFTSQDNLSASPGMEFIRVRVRFTSGSDETQRISSERFSLETEEGRQNRVEKGMFLDTHNVNSGESVEGVLLFEVPLNAKNLILVYSGENSLTNTKIRIQ